MVKFTRMTQHAVNFQKWIFVLAILFSAAVTNGTQLQSKSCTNQQASKNRNAFSFRTFGNVSSLEDCVDLCCGDETCELAILSKGFHCFGVSCFDPKVCHKILDRLLMDDEREIRRSSRITGTKDFIRHTSQIANPKCPRRFVPSFQVLLLGRRSPRDVYKLRAQPTDASQCSAQCCRSRDCSLSFIEDDECFGVTGASGNGSNSAQGSRIGLQIAIIDRNKEVSRSLDDDDEDPDELGSDDADQDTPTAKPVVSTIKSKSKFRHFTDIPKRGKSHKLTVGKIASSSVKQTKRTFASGAHIAGKSDATYSTVPLRKIGVTENRKPILPSGKDRFSHFISKVRALNVNGADKHTSEVSNMVRTSDSSARKQTTIHGHTRRNETPKQKEHSSPTLVGNHKYEASALWKFKGSKFDPKSRKVRFESFASHSAEKSFLEDDEVGSSQNFYSSSYEEEGFSAEGEMSGDDVVSGDFGSSGDGDLSGYGYLSGHRLPIGAVKDSSEGYNDASEEGEGQNDAEDESGYDSSGENRHFSGNYDDFSGDSVDTMTHNPMRHELSAGEREEYETTRKTVDINYSGSGDWESDKGSADNSEIQKKTSLNKNNKKRKEMDLVEALDDLDENTTRKLGSVVPLPQRGIATMKSKMKANSSHLKSQKDVKEIKKSKIIEHLNDLGSGDADSEKSSKEVAKLHQEANNSREEGKKKGNKKRQKLKHKSNSREKNDLMEEADDLGSDDGNEKISQSIEHLLHETTNSAKKQEKVDSKQISLKKNDSLRRKSELVDDPDDLGSDDHDEKIARKATHLLQETRTSKTAKKWEKAGKETMKLKEDSISKKSTIAEVPNSFTSADSDDGSSRKVFIAHKQSRISEAENQNKKFLRKRVIVKSQKEGSKREEIEHAEDPDDLGTDNDDEEKALKALSRLSYQISTPKVTKNRKNHLTLKKEGIVKEKVDLVEDVDELGSDDSDPLSANQDTSRKMATRLPPQTQVSKTDRKQQKFNRSSSTKEKTDFVQALNHLGLHDEKSGMTKLRKHDALTPTKVTKLSKTSNPSISGESKKTVKYLKSSDGQTASNLNLAEDLDDLGADDDYVDETKLEQPALSLPVRTNDRTGQVNSEQRTSSGGHMGSPPRNKDTKQASTTFGLSVGDGNKSHIVSRQSGHSVSGGLTHHGISRKGGHVLGPFQVKGKSNATKARRVKDEKHKQTMHIEEKKPGQVASLKQVKKPSPPIKTENILNSKNGEAIDQNKGTKGNRKNPHQTKLTVIEPTKTRKVPPSSETLKAITKNRSDGVLLNNQATLTKTKTGMVPIASNDKLKVSLKAHIANKNHLNVTSKGRAEKSTLRDENKSAIKANQPKESVALKRKGAEKQRKTPSIDGHKNRSTFVSRKGTKKSSEVSSKLEVIDDLMKFAHRKKSVKKEVEHFAVSGKKTTSGETIVRQQGRETILTNDNGTIRGKQPMILHRTKTKTIYPVHRKRVIISHLQSSGKLAAKKSQTTASPPVSRHFPLTTQFHASSKKNGSSSSFATLTSNGHFRTQETNPPERNLNTYNRAFISLKQRSNEQVLDNKNGLLAHFRNVNGSDGIEFLVKSSGSHHKEKHSKHDLSFDLDDIGDADFDIMMSNDIPHKHLPEKKKGKQRKEKHTKSSYEKQRDPSPNISLKKKRKNSDGELRNKGEDNSEESEPDSETHQSHHKHKKITKDVITPKRHRHHHLPLKETDNNVDSNDRDETHFSRKVEKGRSHDQKKSQSHDRHDTFNNADEKDSERVHHYHKKHRHRPTTIKKDDLSDDKDNNDDSKVESDHKKRRKESDKAKSDDKSEEDERVEHHKHRSHKAHKKKYDNNDWEGKIIPGKVKLVYEKDSNRKRHHKHETRNEEEINHQKQKHAYEAKKSGEDSENNKDDSHSHHEHHTESDDYNQHKKHAKDHEAVEKDDSEEKGKIKNDNKEEHAEKKKEVNYEAIKTGRHRFVQHDDHNEGETHQGDDYDGDRDDGSSWTSKTDDKGDENEKSDDNDNNSDERGKGDDSEDANASDADDNDKEERPSKESKKNMVVLGEDSDSDDDDDRAKHSRKGHERRHGHRHMSEHNIDEQENEKDYLEHSYHQENHKSTRHHRHRHKYHRHLKAKHRHHESDYENKEDDYNDGNDDDDETESRKSFIKHRKEKEDEIRRDRYDNKRNRKKQYYHDTAESSEENKDYRARKFHRSHHRHHHSRPVVDTNKIRERPVDGYEPDDEKDHVVNNEEHDEQEKFPRRHRTHEHGPTEGEDNYENFQREKDGPDDHFAPPERDRERWKFKPEEYHREFKGASHQLDNQDFSDNRFMGEGSLKGYHHNRRPEYNERPKFKPRKRKKERWKNRYYYNDNEDQDYEDSGGLFDSSSWTPNENYDDDDFYGGEGNHERRHYRKKHRKYKNRKDRQSYEYWAYGNQYPFYDYKYHRVRSRYQNNQRQPNPHYDWHNRYRNYNGWKSTPSNWYSDKQPWDGTRSWRHHPKWRQRFDGYKPTGYQWHKFYDNNDYYRDRNQPRPTAYLREASTFLPPTSSIWQKQLHATDRGFIGDKRLSQNREPGENYQDWSRYKPSASLNQASSTYGPQQRPLAGFQPRPNPDAVKPVDQTQPLGVVSNYVPSASQQGPGRIDNQTKFRPTVRRQYAGTPPRKVLTPTNDFIKIKNLMDKLNTSSPASNIHPPTSVTSNVQNNTNIKNGLPKINVSSSGQDKDQNRLNGFFNEESAGKKSDILRSKNNSQKQPATNVLGNTTQPEQHTLPKTTSNPAPAKLAPQPTQAADKTNITHTTPIHTTTNNRNHTISTPKQDAQTSSTTAAPTQKSTTEQSTVAPNIGDVSQSDDSSETGKKHRKHRAPVCIAGKTTDDVTLLRGKKAGNFTNIGDVGDFGMCIKRCCQQKNCDVAFKSSETCFLVSCFSKESCKTSPSLDDIFSPRMCFVRRHLLESERGRGHDDDDDDEWNDKISPSGIHEVCEAERALGIMWTKTGAGHYSRHPCPREAKGFVKRRCEADSRWLPPNFSDCVSNDYQALFEKSRKLAGGADPSPLIRELSLLTTQNIDNSLIFGGDLDRATDIMAAIVQHNGQTDSLDMTREDVENFVRASSNLLDMTNQQEWYNIQKNKPGSAGVLRLMEMFALQAARRLPREDMADPAITNNIIIKLDRKSPGEGGLTFPDFSNPRIDRWDARHDVIALPSSVFDQGEVSTASINFKSLPYLLPDTNVSTGLGPNSKVISTVMHPHPQGKITPPVTVVLTHIKKRRGHPKCVFWDYTLSPHRGGAWSSRGCWLAFNNQSHSICQCSHLSNFAVLMDLSSDKSLQKEQKRERTMALMWIGIPVLIVGVIGGLYMSFSWNRKSGIPSTVTRPSTSLNEKTGLLGQRVVTSQVREEFPASPRRDLYRALSPGYSPTGDLEWQDEFDFDVESGDQRFKQMLLPKLQLLQNQLINEFYDASKMETKKKILNSKIEEKTETETPSPESKETNAVVEQQKAQLKPTKTRNSIEREPSRKRIRQSRTSSSAKLRVRFADESPPSKNRTGEDKERFKRLQQMERRVFAQHLSRWAGNSHLNLSE